MPVSFVWRALAAKWASCVYLVFLFGTHTGIKNAQEERRTKAIVTVEPFCAHPIRANADALRIRVNRREHGFDGESVLADRVK